MLFEYEHSDCLDRKRKLPKTKNEDLNLVCWEWYQRLRSRNVAVSGAMVQNKALIYATQQGNTDFKASNGWLDSFRKRNNIVFKDKVGALSRHQAN